MNSKRIVITLIALVALLMLAGTSTAWAMSPQGDEIGLKALTDAADVVVTGRVVDLRAAQDSPDALIYTYATIDVGQVAKGAVDAQIVVKIEGGVVGNIGLMVSESPAFKLGQDVLLFLDNQGADLQVIAGKQGKYTIADGRLLENDLALDMVMMNASMLVNQPADAVGLSAFDLDMSGIMDLASVDESFSWYGHHWAGPQPMGELFYIYENTADCTGEGAAVQAAAATWSAVSSVNFNYSYGGATTLDAPLLDGKNVIRWSAMGEYPQPIAVAYTWYYADTMTIFEADMIFNDTRTWSADPSFSPPDRYDVQNIATHELGHWLGLKDLYDVVDYEKTMCGYASPGETRKRTLEAADILGAQTIYPGVTSAPVSVTPNDGGNVVDVWQDFTVVYESANGVQDMSMVEFMLNTTTDTTMDSVLLRYNVQQDLLYLQDRWTEGVWLPSEGISPGVEQKVKHGLVQVNAQTCSVTSSTTMITVTWSLAFTQQAGRQFDLYARVQEQGGAWSVWADLGDWLVNVPPECAEFVEAGMQLDVNTRYRYNMRFIDRNGYDDLAQVYLLITTTLPSTMTVPGQPLPYAYTGAVLLKYDLQQNAIYMRNAIDTKWVPYGGITPGEREKEKHPQGILRGLKSRTLTTDIALNLRLNLQLREPMIGQQNVYMRAVDKHGAELSNDSGWVHMGTLTILPIE